MKSSSHTILAFLGLLVLFLIGVYNLLDLFNANWIPDVIYEWTGEQSNWGKLITTVAYMLLIFIPIFTFAFYIRNSLSPKQIICKSGTNIIRLTQKAITRAVKEVLHRIPAIISTNVKVWNKGDKVFVEVGAVVRAGALLPELTEDIKQRTKDTMTRILGIQNIGLVRAVIEDIKFRDKEVVGKIYEQKIPLMRTEAPPINIPESHRPKTSPSAHPSDIKIFDAKTKFESKPITEEIKKEVVKKDEGKPEEKEPAFDKPPIPDIKKPDTNINIKPDNFPKIP